jgi:hypothetical protein
MTLFEENPSPHLTLAEQASDPTTPASGKWRLYTKSGGLYIIDDAGTVVGPFAAATGGGYTEGARVYNNANQAIGSGAVLTAAFNGEVYDTDTCHDNSTNNSRLTCKTAGKYLVTAHAVLSSVAGDSSWWIEHQTRGRVAQQNITAQGGSLATIIDLAVDDYLVVKVFAGTGNACNLLYVAGNEYSSYFAMQRIG